MLKKVRPLNPNKNIMRHLPLLMLCTCLLFCCGQITKTVATEQPPVYGGTFKVDEPFVVPKGQNGYNLGGFFYHYLNDNSQFEELFKTLKPELIRFPGGTIANFYHPDGKGYGLREKDFSGDADAHVFKSMKARFKQEQKLISSGQIKGNFIDRLSKLSAKTGTKVVYVANLLTADVNETVQAVNKLQKAGVDVVGIELGNEYYLKAYHQHFKSVDDYIVLAEKFAKRLKSEFPSIPLGAIASPNEHIKPMGAKQKEKSRIWNQKLAGKHFYDAAIVHLYLFPTKCKNAGGKTAIFNCAWNESKRFFNQYAQKCFTDYEQLFGKKKLWVTEWNIQGSTQYFGNTFLQALYCEQFALEMMAHKQVEMAVLHNLLGKGDGFNIIKDQAGKYVPQSAYYSSILLRDLYGDYKMQSKGKNYVLFVHRNKPKKRVALAFNSSQSSTSFDMRKLIKQGAINYQKSSIKAQSFETTCKPGLTGFEYKQPKSVTSPTLTIEGMSIVRVDY